MSLTQAGEVALRVILAALEHLPLGQRKRVLDAAYERQKFDARGQALLDARKAKGTR